MPKQSACRPTASNRRSTIYSVASSARSSVHANARLGHSFIFHDATHAGKAQTISGINSMTQASAYGGWMQLQWPLGIGSVPTGSRATDVAFGETRAMRHCKALYSCLLVSRLSLRAPRLVSFLSVSKRCPGVCPGSPAAKSKLGIGPCTNPKRLTYRLILRSLLLTSNVSLKTSH